MATIDAMQSTDAHKPGPQTQTVIKTFEQFVVPNYRRFDICLVRGEGSRVWDADGRSYLGFVSGLGLQFTGALPRPSRAGCPKANGKADSRSKHLVYGTSGNLGETSF